jgi:hypothetical protein
LVKSKIQGVDLNFVYLKVELDGLTGKIKFDSRGLRVDFELEIVELKKDGLQKVRSLKKIRKKLI